MEKQQFEKFCRKANEMLLAKVNAGEIDLTQDDVLGNQFSANDLNDTWSWQPDQWFMDKLTPELVEEIDKCFQSSHLQL